MSKLPIISAKQCIAVLVKKKFFPVKKTGGSHQKLKNEDGRPVIVPMHKELARGTLKSIIEQAGLTEESFLESLK